MASDSERGAGRTAPAGRKGAAGGFVEGGIVEAFVGSRRESRGVAVDGLGIKSRDTGRR